MPKLEASQVVLLRLHESLYALQGAFREEPLVRSLLDRISAHVENLEGLLHTLEGNEERLLRTISDQREIIDGLRAEVQAKITERQSVVRGLSKIEFISAMRQAGKRRGYCPELRQCKRIADYLFHEPNVAYHLRIQYPDGASERVEMIATKPADEPGEGE